MFKIKNITKSIKHIKKILTPSSHKTTCSSIVASTFDMETSNKITSDFGFSKKYVVNNSKETDWVGIRKAIYNRFSDEIDATNIQSLEQVTPLVASKQQGFSATNVNINWAEIRALIYNRFADEIHAWSKKQHGDIIKYSPVRDVNEELEIIKEQGYSFAKQKAALKRSITDKWDEIERIKYLSQDTSWNTKSQQKLLSHDNSIIGRMKFLSIKGYLSNYAGDDELSQSIDSVIKIKDTLITEFMNRVYDKHMHATAARQNVAEAITFDSLIDEREVMVLGE